MGYKILLADDSVTVQKIITLTFSDEGVEVIAVNNGDEAINWLKRLRPALVMADICIPGRNGYEICEFVKAHPEMEGTPVILLVPAFEPFDEERARRIGADHHLTKPFQSIRTLISIVKNLIDRKTDAEFSVADDNLTTVREPERKKSNTAEFNSRRAKIEELIRLSAQSSSENGVENGTPLKINPPHGNGRHLDLPAITSPPRKAEIIEDVNMDNILELDDVLSDLTSMPMRPMRPMRPMGPIVESAPLADAVPHETQGGIVIPQSAIDEIVNRVSAQLSAQLVEKLSGEIARRIAPEVVELVRRQLFAEPTPYRDPENLLDID